MLTVLINVSIIWLCSLLFYELLLKKQTFHRLNRFYLLFTLIAGILLPLLPWGKSVQATILDKDAAMIAVAPATTTAGSAVTIPVAALQEHFMSISCWQFLYITGLAAALLYQLRELWQLRQMYRHSVIQRQEQWIIATTGRPHSPLSFLRIIFISGRDQYTEREWQMLLQHEQQHYHSRHILDLLLMQLVAVLLWFHPLVYIYRYKLRLLHEYEVDSLQQGDVQSYGRFLLEQATLKPG